MAYGDTTLTLKLKTDATAATKALRDFSKVVSELSGPARKAAKDIAAIGTALQLINKMGTSSVKKLTNVFTAALVAQEQFGKTSAKTVASAVGTMTGAVSESQREVAGINKAAQEAMAEAKAAEQKAVQAVASTVSASTPSDSVAAAEASVSATRSVVTDMVRNINFPEMFKSLPGAIGSGIAAVGAGITRAVTAGLTSAVIPGAERALAALEARMLRTAPGGQFNMFSGAQTAAAGFVKTLFSVRDALNRVQGAFQQGLGTGAISVAREGFHGLINTITMVEKALLRTATNSQNAWTRMAASASSSITHGIILQLERVKQGALAVGRVTSTMFRAMFSDIKNVHSGLIMLGGALHRFSNAGRSITDMLGTSFVQLRSFMFVALFFAMSVGRAMSFLIREAVQYSEAMHLFGTVFGDMAEQANEYADKVTSALGLDPVIFKRTYGTFYEMSRAMGIASDTADKMSKNLTQLSYDYASLFDMDFATVTQKFQSALSGQTKAIRTFGLDITIASLQEELYRSGINASVNSLTRAQKAQLAVNVMVRQSATAHGDLARTITQPANMMRILADQTRNAARTMGSAFLPALQAILPWLITITIWVEKTVRAFLALRGITLPDWSEFTKGAKGGAGGVEDLYEETEKAGKAAKKLKSFMLGMDELNVMPSATDGGGGGGAGGGAGVDIPVIDPYDFTGGVEAIERITGPVMEKMAEWAKKIEPFTSALRRLWAAMVPFGQQIWGGITSFFQNTLMPFLTTQLNGNGVDLIERLIEKFEWLEQNPQVGDTIGQIIGLFLTLKGVSTIVSGLSMVLGIFGAFFKIGTLSKILSGIGTSFQFIGAVIAGFKGAEGAGAFAGVTKAIGGIQAGLSGLGISLGWVLAIVAIVALSVMTWWDKVKEALTPLFRELGDTFKGLWESIMNLWDSLKSGAEDGLAVWQVFSAVVATIFTALVGAIIGAVKGIVIAFGGVIDMITGVVDIVVGIFGLLVGIFTGDGEKIKESFFKIVDGIIGILQGAITTIIGLALTIILPIIDGIRAGWNFIKDWTMAFLGWLWGTIVKVAVGIATVIWNRIVAIGQFFVSLGKWIWNVIKRVAGFFTWVKNMAVLAFKILVSYAIQLFVRWVNNVRNNIDRIVKFFQWLRDLAVIVVRVMIDKIIRFFVNLADAAKLRIENIKTNFRNAKTAIVDLFKNLGTWFKDKVWGKLSGGLEAAWKGIKSIFKTGVNFIIRLINNGPIKLINTLLDAAKSLPGMDNLIPNVPTIPLLARGGMVNTGSLFIAGESGPELMGSYRGNRNTVMPLENTGFVQAVASAVSDAVFTAVSQANAQQTSGGESAIYLDGVKVGKAIDKSMNRRFGANPIVSIQ